jgi:protein-disulfide isomerase
MSKEAKILTGIAVVTLIIVVGAAFLFGGKSTPDKQVLSTDQMKYLLRSNTHQTGPKNAKVTLVEFGDFQCPACGAAYPIVEQILNEYQGKINFAFREFPLPVHQNSQIAAEAAEAAGAQGKFFDMYNTLYSNQKDWGETNNPMDYFTKYAEGMHLDMDKFKNDVNSKKYQNVINTDLNDGAALNVDATPTFFINGQPQVGGLAYTDFKAKIDQALKAAK